LGKNGDWLEFANIRVELTIPCLRKFVPVPDFPQNKESNMELKPIKQYTDPAFPTRTVLDAQPELLRLVPRRWRESAVVLGALSMVCALAPAARAVVPAAETKEKPVSRVAPLFQYVEPAPVESNFPPVAGGIRAPARFLTEDEARAVIIEEAKKAGITFTADKQTVKDVSLMTAATKKEPAKLVLKTDIALDGTDEKLRIGYEFVSQADWTGIGKQAKNYAISDNISTAKSLRSGLEAVKPEGTYVVFHDPDIYSLETAKTELRKQVQDFVKWLKAQGVI